MLGDILREARKAKNLTLRELAEQVGVSTGYISHLENSRFEPSLAVLRKLTDYLDIPANIALDMKGRKASAILVKKEERATLRFGNLFGEAEMLTPVLWKGLVKPRIEAIELKVPGNSPLIKETIAVDTDEWIYVLDGCIEYRKGVTVEILEKGDSLYIPKMTGHSLRNPVAEPACIIWLTRGGSL